ncbi:hypothetical protein KNSL1_011155 [Colletotrichum chrysophilum]|nr:hypothetical protein KNSL1_011155 [Colletotrichum chrysophilum]
MKSQLAFFYLPCALLAPITAAEKSFQDYILAPTSRVISPVAIHQTGGNVENAAGFLTINGAGVAGLPNAGSTTFSGNGSYVTLDFGKNIAGRVGFQVDAVSGTSDSIGFTFSESSMYISAQFCDSVQPEQFDMPQWFNNTTPGYYQAGHEFQRGAFRYLTVVHNSTGTISLSNVTNALTLAAILNATGETRNWEAVAAGISQAANNILWDESASLYRDNDTIASESSTTSYPQDGNSWAIISRIANGKRAEAISDALKARWIRPYGAPAVEAGQTISPFATGFELQAHYMAGHPDYAVDLMEFMWADYMLDNPLMTNSTFIEGFATDGTPLYPVYDYNPRVSHAHGWSTAPTSLLTFHAGGLTMTSAVGRTWKVAPALGGLKAVQASYETPLGTFKTSWVNSTHGLSGTFETPNSTTGELVMPLFTGTKKMVLKGPKGTQEVPLADPSSATVMGLCGGKYSVEILEDHLRYMGYHPRSLADDLKVANTWSRAHTDFGSLTLLWSQDVAGLQIKTSSGEWKYVPPVDNGIVCNVGDTLDFWSAGYLKSTTHRVVRPPEDQAYLFRQGLFYFVRPGDDVDIKPAPSPLLKRLGLVKQDAENAEPVTGLQYVRERVKNYHHHNDYADMKGKKFKVGNLEIEDEAD